MSSSIISQNISIDGQNYNKNNFDHVLTCSNNCGICYSSKCIYIKYLLSHYRLIQSQSYDEQVEHINRKNCKYCKEAIIYIVQHINNCANPNCTLIECPTKKMERAIISSLLKNEEAKKREHNDSKAENNSNKKRKKDSGDNDLKDETNSDKKRVVDQNKEE